MLMQAVNKFIMASREYSEQSKAQYTDKGNVKNYFRASELGGGDRKILYGFFKHQIPVIPRTTKNLRQLANGDSMHARYQKWWEDMGVLISMEERLSSKDDDYLKQFEWEWAGHYDGLLDVNILRAHAQDLCTIGYSKNEDTDQWEIEVDIDDTYAKSIGLYTAEGEYNEAYEALPMVADLKTMNPWGFKRVANGDVSELRGYIDQITFYMYMLNTPYGSIYIEDKGSNDLVEVQILWHDMHEGADYQFTPEIHGEPADGVLRVVVDSERFYGSDQVLGVVARVNQLWETKKLLEAAQATNADMADIMPPRCSESPDAFPCSWGKGAEKCEFFNHCWNQYTNGLSIVAYEACPEELQWEIIAEGEANYKVDSRKVPAGVTLEALQALVDMQAVDISQFLVDTEADVAPEVEEEDLNADHLFDSGGELNLGPATVEFIGQALNVPITPAAATPAAATPTKTVGSPAAKSPSVGKPVLQGGPAPANKVDTAATALPNVAVEYINADNKKAIKCLKCSEELTYMKLGNGCTKKCEKCGNVNKVLRA